MLIARVSSSPIALIGPCLALGALLTTAAVPAALAEDVFTFPDDATLKGDMSELGALMADDIEVDSPCRFHVLEDQRGRDLFDDRTLQAMGQALATAIIGFERAGDCKIDDHSVEQAELPAYLDELEQSGRGGLALALSFYRLGDDVAAFATLRGTDGRFLGSSGRYDLAVVEGAAAAAAGVPDANGAEENAVEAAEAVPAAVLPEEGDGHEADHDTSAANSIVLPESVLRSRLASDAQVDRAPARSFNLRRVLAGIEGDLETLRIADASGRDTDLIADLAEGFLQDVTAEDVAITTTDLKSSNAPGLEVAIEGRTDDRLGSIDIRSADDGRAFDRIFDHDVDLVITRRPISAGEQARFEAAYGVNMRSRYAEHVIAIASSDIDAVACGISYPPENDILIKTEDHPASERVYAYANPAIPGDVRDRFIAYALSAEGQRVVVQHEVDLRLRMGDAGYTAWRYQTTGAQPAEVPDVRERFRDLIRTSQRVSSTFRFDHASADLVLDSRSERDLENLIALAKNRDIDGRRIMLFGFADSTGPAPFNVGLSEARAGAVATRLRLAGIRVPPRNVHGIGEDSPIACNDRPDGSIDLLGTQKNRRVEVWIES